MKTYLSRITFVIVIVLFGAMAAPRTWAKDDAATTDGNLDIARKLESAFEKVADQASESVVIITVTQKVNGQADVNDGDEDNGGDQNNNNNNNNGGGQDDSPFKYFFPHHGAPAPQTHDVDSEGSGIIIRSDGYILTNNHVVDHATQVTVRLKDGRVFENARIIGQDDMTDVAVIKIDAKDLPVAQLGDSGKVRVGQWAIAIGAPYELDYTFTVGFVSAKGRSAVWNSSANAYEDYIQTDAAINPGNSGGPLCDIEGRVIGINTLIRGLNRGIGFAIPIDMARDVSDQLIAKGRVVRAAIGISIDPLSDIKELQERYKDLKDGVVVMEIRPNTPAASSELQPADVIVGIDGVPVKSPKELQTRILQKRIGDKVVLDVVRDGKPIKIALKTAEMQSDWLVAERVSPANPELETTLGLTVQTLTKDLAKQFDVPETRGVVVTDVADGSPAQESGLQHGDVITEVERTAVAGADEFKAAVAKADGKKSILLYVKRDGVSTFAVLKQSP
jgi:Do/DeqQ family serine protease